MKIFISWSGDQSKKCAECFKDWIPAVLQAVTPYFTPSDIEKGARWLNDIGKELDESNIGIICLTKDNIHSDWILFESGALSKKLEKSSVCPILFGITNTDIAGPLKQFQTTEFQKQDFQKLFSNINSKLGDNKLPTKTFELVFNKWWPDFEFKINEILKEQSVTNDPIRSDREILEEVLEISRLNLKRSGRQTPSPKAIKELLLYYIELHNQQATEQGSYQETLDQLQKLHKSIEHIAKTAKNYNPEIDNLIQEFSELNYEVDEPHTTDLDDAPF